MNERTVEQLHDWITQHSCALRCTFIEDGKPRSLEMIQDKGGIYVTADNGKYNYIGGFSPDDELSKVDCNRLAKDFIKTYTLEQLQNDYITACENKYNAEVARQRKNEADATFFESNIEAFNACVSVGKFEVKRYAETVLTMQFRTVNDFEYDYSYSTSYKIEVKRITDNTFSATMEYSERGGYKPYRISFMTFEQLITEIKAFNDKFMTFYAGIIAKRAETDLQRQKETKLKNLCYSIVNDKQNAYIFKTASGYFAVTGIRKWSMKGEGKFTRCYPDKLFEMMQDGKIKGYVLSSEEETSRLHGKPELLKALDYIAIV